MDHFLINPKQCKAYGVYLWDNTYDLIKGYEIDANDDLHIPMRTKEKNKLFKMRVPTQQETSSAKSPIIVLISPKV